MRLVFWFLFGYILMCETSDVDSDNAILKPSSTKDDDILFKDRQKISRIAQQKCNSYILQACNGILTLQRSTTSIPFSSVAMNSPPLNTNTSTENKTLPANAENFQNFTTVDNVESFIPPQYVVGGQISSPREFPHMALIGYGNYTEVKWLCGGSLISEKFVLSAAHCSSTSRGPALWVRLGELDLDTKTEESDTKDFQIIEKIVHPGYSPPSLYHDIALFKLKTSATFNDFVRPICLNTLQDLNVIRAIATGWGSTGYAEKESPKLLNVDLDVQDPKNCDKIYKGERLQSGFNSSTMICVGYAPGGKDTCQGDSGGPLQVPLNAGCPKLYLQIGIVSFGEGCAFPDTPGVYTKVSYYIPWIENIVWK